MTESHKPGDIVNGHVLTINAEGKHVWVPIEAPKVAATVERRTPSQKFTMSILGFCIALGGLVFFFLAHQGLTADGLDCGSVLNASTYEVNPLSTNPYASSNTDTANSDCSDARSTRRTTAIAAGGATTIVLFGGIALIRRGRQIE